MMNQNIMVRLNCKQVNTTIKATYRQQIRTEQREYYFFNKILKNVYLDIFNNEIFYYFLITKLGNF